jgi:hypothetical protein
LDTVSASEDVVVTVAVLVLPQCGSLPVQVPGTEAAPAACAHPATTKAANDRHKLEDFMRPPHKVENQIVKP